MYLRTCIKTGERKSNQSSGGGGWVQVGGWLAGWAGGSQSQRTLLQSSSRTLTESLGFGGVQ